MTPQPKTLFGDLGRRLRTRLRRVIERWAEQPRERACILRLLLTGEGLSGPELVARSDGVLSRGVVYGVLMRLEEDGAVRVTLRERSPKLVQLGFLTQRVYHLGPAGESTLAALSERYGV